MEGIDARDALAALTALAVAVLSGWFGLYQFRQAKKKEDTASLAQVLAAYNSLNDQLMKERKDREAAITALNGQIDGMKEEAEDKDRRLTDLWIYTGQLESLIRESGLTLPAARPSYQEVPAYTRITRQGKKAP